MATISSPGLGSGLDVSGIISKLMEVESQPLTALTRTEASYQAKLSAFGSMQGALSTLQSAATALKTPATFTGKSASVSDSTVLAASASSTATSSTFSISVTQLAKYNAIRSNTNYAATTDTFNGGTLSVKIGTGTAVDVTIASGTTLSGLRQAINDANAGVTATIVNDGSTNRLVLTSKTSGTDGAITVTANDSGSGGTNSLADLDTTAGNIVITQTADDANLTVNGIAITRSSNIIDDAIDGVTMNLSKGTLASPGTAIVTIAANTGTVTSAVDAFVKAYNDVVKQLKSMTSYDPTTKQSSVLTGDSTTRNIQSQLSSLVQSSVSGVNGGITRMSDVGINVQKDGTLAVNSSKLTAALNDPDKDVASLFTQTTTGNKGVAVRFNDLLESLVGTDGLISSRTEGINTSIKNVQARAEALNRRLTSIESRYRAQFTALDTLISSMQQTSSFLTQQLANMSTTST